jgi:hypothetical protein
MNVHDPKFGKGEIAQIHYGDGEITMIRPGRFVICAVSGKRIPIENLRYWSVAQQEAYAGPAEALERWKALNSKA